MSRVSLLAFALSAGAVIAAASAGCSSGQTGTECNRSAAFADRTYGYLGPSGAGGCAQNFRCYAEPGEATGKCAPAGHCGLPPGPYVDGYYSGPGYYPGDCRANEICVARGLPPVQRAYYGECLPQTFVDAGADAASDAGAPSVLSCGSALPDKLVHDNSRAVDYLVTCELPIEKRLDVDPGVVIAFQTGAGFTVRKTGALVVSGTQAAPVKMVAAAGTTKWLGLQFFNTSADNALTFAEISNAGAQQANFAASVTVGAASYGPGAVSIRDCVIDASGAVGLSVGEGGDTPVLEGLVVKGAAGVPVEVNPDVIGRLGGARNRFLGSAKDAARILSVDPTRATDTTWAKLDVPYLVTGTVKVAGKQTLKPGVTVLMGKDAVLQVGAVGAFTGSLVAIGTAAERISFKRESAGVGWQAISLPNPGSELAFADVSGGGSVPNAFGHQANIILSADAGGSDVSIRDCVIEGSGGWGVYSAGQTVTQGQGNVFQNNVSGDVSP